MNTVFAFIEANPMFDVAFVLLLIFGVFVIVRVGKSSSPTPIIKYPTTAPYKVEPPYKGTVTASYLPPANEAAYKYALGISKGLNTANVAPPTEPVKPPTHDDNAMKIDTAISQLHGVADIAHDAPEHIQEAAKVITAAIKENLTTSIVKVEPKSEQKSEVEQHMQEHVGNLQQLQLHLEEHDGKLNDKSEGR